MQVIFVGSVPNPVPVIVNLVFKPGAALVGETPVILA